MDKNAGSLAGLHCILYWHGSDLLAAQLGFYLTDKVLVLLLTNKNNITNFILLFFSTKLLDILDLIRFWCGFCFNHT